MANKIYKVALVADEEAVARLQRCCYAYVQVFNRALQIQLDYMTHRAEYKEPILSFNNVLEEIQKQINGTKKFKRIEDGIVMKAIESSYYYFCRWWREHIKGDRRLKDISFAKRTNTFKTSTILKVSKGGYVYFPKFRRVKLVENNYVPLGSYKNAKVIREGKTWYISLEATEAQEEKHNLSGILEVHISANGDISFKDKFYPNVIEKENYKAAEAKQQKLIKSLKKKIKVNSYIDANGEEVVNFSNNMRLTKQRIESTYYKMRNIKVEYFRQIVKDILKEEPEVLNFIYDSEFGEKTQFTSRLFKKSSTWDLLKMIRARMKSIGTKITYSDNIKEEVYKTKFDKNDFLC